MKLVIVVIESLIEVASVLIITLAIVAVIEAREVVMGRAAPPIPPPIFASILLAAWLVVRLGRGSRERRLRRKPPASGEEL